MGNGDIRIRSWWLSPRWFSSAWLPQPPSEVYPLRASHRSSCKDKKKMIPKISCEAELDLPFFFFFLNILSQSLHSPLFQIWWRISCPSVSLSLCPVCSCLPPRTVSFPHWRREELKKKKKRKEKKSLPLLSPKVSSDRRVPPCCPSTRVLLVWISSDRTSLMVKTHGRRQPDAEDCDGERAQSEQVAPLPLWETPGSSSSLAALRMCFGVAVPPFTPCVIRNMLTADQLKRKRLLQTPACTETGTTSKDPNISLWSGTRRTWGRFCEARSGTTASFYSEDFFFFSKERSKKDQIMSQNPVKAECRMSAELYVCCDSLPRTPTRTQVFRYKKKKRDARRLWFWDHF